MQTSPSGTHVRFAQRWNDVPIWGAEAVVSFDAALAPTVVASDLAAFRAVLGDGACGDLFRAGDAAACAEAVVRLLSDRERREALRATGLRRAHRYDWSRVVPDIEAVYETVTAGVGGVAPDRRQGR